jgi:hypothetical protein
MTIRSLAIRGLAAVLVGAVLAPAARAQSDAPFNIKQSFARANVVDIDPGTGLTTQVLLLAIDAKDHAPGGAPFGVTQIQVVVQVFDSSFNLYFLGSGILEGDGATVSVAKNLGSAKVAGTVDVFDVFGPAVVPVALDVTFDGEGEVTRDQENTQVNDPGFKFGEHTISASRDASLSGTITIGAAAFTPDSAILANFGLIKDGTVSFAKP